MGNKYLCSNTIGVRFGECRKGNLPQSLEVTDKCENEWKQVLEMWGPSRESLQWGRVSEETGWDSFEYVNEGIIIDAKVKKRLTVVYSGTSVKVLIKSSPNLIRSPKNVYRLEVKLEIWALELKLQRRKRCQGTDRVWRNQYPGTSF